MVTVVSKSPTTANHSPQGQLSQPLGYQGTTTVAKRSCGLWMPLATVHARMPSATVRQLTLQL